MEFKSKKFRWNPESISAELVSLESGIHYSGSGIHWAGIWNPRATWIPLHGAKTSSSNSKQNATTTNRECKHTQHATPINVGSCWQTLLRPFERSFAGHKSNLHVTSSQFVCSSVGRAFQRNCIGCCLTAMISSSHVLSGVPLNYRKTMVAKEAFYSKSPTKRLHG